MPRGSIPKYVDEDIFNEESKRKWYLLGLSFPTYSQHIQLGKAPRNIWQSSSKELIEIIKSCLQSEHHISGPLRNKNIRPGEHDFEIYRLSMSNWKIYNSLQRAGLDVPQLERKFPPGIDEQHLPHFLRGFFDAKASVYISSQRDLVCTVHYNNKFLHHLDQKLIASTSIKDSQRRTFPSITYHGKNVHAICDFLYRDQQEGLYVLSRRERFFQQKSDTPCHR